MSGHIRANLWLLILTLLLCSAVYPLVLWGIAHAAFPSEAEGSIVPLEGRLVGSRLIAQPFHTREYFQPRPSAASYNASASAGSNWGASSPLLRDRVARQLGTLARFRAGDDVGPAIERWFGQQGPDVAARWARDNPGLAEQWVKNNAGAVAAWLKVEVSMVQEGPGTVVAPFFESFADAHPNTWPSVSDQPLSGAGTTRELRPMRAGDDVRATFFESWRRANPEADLEPVPADLVMASGSGLDPHITLGGARYQLPRVTAAWAERTGRNEAALRQEIDELLERSARAPLGGLIGVELVNVLEVNQALRQRYGAWGNGSPVLRAAGRGGR